MGSDSDSRLIAPALRSTVGLPAGVAELLEVCKTHISGVTSVVSVVTV